MPVAFPDQPSDMLCAAYVQVWALVLTAWDTSKDAAFDPQVTCTTMVYGSAVAG